MPTQKIPKCPPGECTVRIEAVKNSTLSKRSRSSESSGSFAIVWVAFPYDRPDRLNIFWDDWDNPDDHMETRLSKPCFCLKLWYREERPYGIHGTRTHWFFLLSLGFKKSPCGSWYNQGVIEIEIFKQYYDMRRLCRTNSLFEEASFNWTDTIS